MRKEERQEETSWGKHSGSSFCWFVWVLLEQFKGNSPLDVAGQEWYRTWVCATLHIILHTGNQRSQQFLISYIILLHIAS